LPTTSQVSLKVYDITGRQVATLLNGWRQAGTHEIVLNGSSLASGTYFYKMVAGNYRSTGKATLLK